MKILFIHQNFPGQFVHLAPALVKNGHEVHALVLKKEVPPEWSGVKLHAYQPTKGTAPGVHPWALDLETKIIRAESVFRKCLELKAQGFHPDVVVAHPGWGESLFLKEVWPKFWRLAALKAWPVLRTQLHRAGQRRRLRPRIRQHRPG